MPPTSPIHDNKTHNETLIYAARELAIATRLKRLSEYLYNTADDIYKELGCEMESRWFPVVFLLSQTAPWVLVKLQGT